MHYVLYSRMDKPTVTDLKQMKWNEINGDEISGVTNEWHLKEVEIDDEHYSTGIVVQRGADVENRQVILDPARKSQVRHEGFA